MIEKSVVIEIANLRKISDAQHRAVMALLQSLKLEVTELQKQNATLFRLVADQADGVLALQNAQASCGRCIDSPRSPPVRKSGRARGANGAT